MNITMSAFEMAEYVILVGAAITLVIWINIFIAHKCGVFNEEKK